MLSAVGHGKRAIRGGLKKTQEDRGSRSERTSEGEVFTGFFIPFQLGLLHEEGLGAVPTGYFDGIEISDWTLGSQ